MNATANVVTSITAGDCERSGRNATSSMASGEHEDDAEAEHDPGPHRPVAVGREGERVGAGHDQLPVREVDQPQDAEDEADADGHEREDRAQPDRVDDGLRVDDAEQVQAAAVHER